MQNTVNSDLANDASEVSTPLTVVEASAEALGRSPIFQLSLSSRELFHSNFLFWLFKTYPDACASMFDDACGTGKFEIYRERDNLDLCLVWANHALIIENKVKDIPRRDQLETYDAKIARTFSNGTVRKIILSLAPPGRWLTGTDWRPVDFRKLGEALEGWCSKAAVSAEDRPIIIGYAKMVQHLHNFWEAATGPDGLPTDHWFLSNPSEIQRAINNELAELRMADTLAKHQASQFMVILQEALGDINCSLKGTAFHLDFEHGLTRKNPLVSVGLNVETRSRNLRVGVQIQGRQYRRFIEFPNIGAPKGPAETLADSLRQRDGYRWLLSPSIEDGTVVVPPGGGLEGRLSTGMRRNTPIKMFGTSFIYQYVNIGSDPGSLHPDTLIDVLRQDLRFARSLLEDGEYLRRLTAGVQGLPA